MEIVKTVVKKPLVIVVIAVVLMIFVIGRKALYYSADPVGEKDCPPLFTPSLQDSSKQTTIQVDRSEDVVPWLQKGGTINDASCLNKTSVYGIVQVTEVQDVEKALQFAHENNLKISPAGVKHSMGGQAFSKHGIVLDMTQFNNIILNEGRKTITVQSGATWHDIQNVLHPKYAVKAMQSTDIFTVGGSISVNAHGMDHQAGSVSKTIRSMNIMLPDGSVQKVSKTEQPELFNLVVGGYGLFGIILDAEIEITDNVVYERGRKIINYKEFPDIFQKELAPNKKIGLMYGHLSTAPQSFLKEMILYTYEEAANFEGNLPPLGEVESTKLRRLVLNLSKQGSAAKRLKWFAEKYIEPKLEGCTVARNQALKEGEDCLVSRNEPMHDSVKYLRNNLKNDADILHEYFIPRAEFVSFIDDIRTVLQDNDANLLNASVRVVHKEDIMLNYAPFDGFALVLYLNQTTDARGNEHMRNLTRELIDITLKHGGRFFLPYQLHYTHEQLRQSYPKIAAFFEAKKRYDPESLLTNTFYETYSK